MDEQKKVFAQSRGGDILEVKMLDAHLNCLYKKRIDVRDKKGIKSIVNDLNNMGIDLKQICSIRVAHSQNLNIP